MHFIIIAANCFSRNFV